jgi:hypothetical protein
MLTMPTVYAYNATVQQQITSKIAVSGGFVGNSGRHMILGTDENFNINQQYFIPGASSAVQATAYPYDGVLGPRYNYGWTEGVNDFCNCANNQYKSFQGTFTFRNMGGYTMQGSYTYQIVQGDGWGGNEGYTFLYDRALGYGNNPLMPHNQLTFSQSFNVPFGRGRRFGAHSNFLVDAVLGGWTLSNITSFYSGFPFMPTIDNYGPNVKPYTGPNNRPDVGSGQVYASNQNRNQWIVGCPGGNCTTGPYLYPASNAFGNWPVNNLYGPHFINVDGALMKTFSVTERFKFTLRVDATNALNHANLGAPNADVQSSTVGQITSLASNYNMRQLQFSGNIAW